jgi:hypothetical protein
MAAKKAKRTRAEPHVDLANSDPIEAVRYVLLLLDFSAEGRKDGDPGGAAAIRSAVKAVREVMKLK